MFKSWEIVPLLFVWWATLGLAVYQEASIYASVVRLGVAINYTEHPDWSDIQDLLDGHGFLGIGTVCVTGAWVTYRDPDYGSYGPGDYDIISGGNHCVEPGNIQSMQPLGQIESAFQNSLTVFKERYFGGLGVPMDGTRGARFFESLGGQPKSLVIIGKSQWTVDVVRDKSVRSTCYATNFDPRENLPICLIPDLSSFGQWEANDTIITFSKGCKPFLKAENVQLVEDCRYFGERRPDPNEPDAYRPRVLSRDFVDKSKQLPPDHGNEEHDEEHDATNKLPPPTPPIAEVYNGTCPGDGIEELVQLLSIRLNHDFTSPTQLLWPTVPEHIWRTEILDMVYDIALAATPDNIVPPEYLMMIREFMVHHLSNAWKSKGGEQLQIPEYFIKNVHKDLEECAVLVAELDDIILERNMEYWMQPGPKSMFETFIRWHGLDIVIDTTWVIGNMVLGLCHHLFESSSNFWATYVHVFNNLYLRPVINDWTSSGVEDQFILGGYDYEAQYERLAAFATTAIEDTPNFHPFDRPLPPAEKARRRRKV